MPDVILPSPRSDRSLLAVSFALFAVAGGVNATTDSLGPSLAGTALTIGGVYSVALFARAVTRKELATLSLVLWSGFLGISGLHVIGVEAIGARLPGAVTLTAVAVTSITWATVLLACSLTVFLGFREYGSTPNATVTDDQVVETDSDYSVR